MRNSALVYPYEYLVGVDLGFYFGNTFLSVCPKNDLHSFSYLAYDT